MLCQLNKSARDVKASQPACAGNEGHRYNKIGVVHLINTSAYSAMDDQCSVGMLPLNSGQEQDLEVVEEARCMLDWETQHVQSPP